MTLILRVLVLIAGLVLLGASALLTKDEEARIERALLGAGQWSRDARVTSANDWIAFIRSVALLTNRCLDLLFGRDPISWRFVAISNALMWTSTGLFAMLG